VVGGSYLTFLRLAVDLPAWRQLNRTQQEFAVGRDKITGCPLTTTSADGQPVTDPGCPVAGTEIFESANDARFAEPPTVDDPAVLSSHVQRANHHVEPASGLTSRRIFRQGYEFLEWNERAPGFRAGLNFVSFQDTPQRVLQMLTMQGWLGSTNFGGDQANSPGLQHLLTVYGGGIYLVPPVSDGDVFPGASTLKRRAGRGHGRRAAKR
jgi:deferrochelatase/peroxidase EfeB